MGNSNNFYSTAEAAQENRYAELVRPGCVYRRKGELFTVIYVAEDAATIYSPFNLADIR
jgi:hypothetical protein